MPPVLVVHKPAYRLPRLDKAISGDMWPDTRHQLILKLLCCALYEEYYRPQPQLSADLSRLSAKERKVALAARHGVAEGLWQEIVTRFPRFASGPLDGGRADATSSLLERLPPLYLRHNPTDPLALARQALLNRSEQQLYAGMFFTPLPVCRAAVEMAACVLGTPTRPWRVIDPAAGTGTMLYAYRQYLEREAVSNERGAAWVDEQWQQVYGVEIEYTNWWLANLNLAIRTADPTEHIRRSSGLDVQGWRGADTWPAAGSYDLVLCNPPYLGQRSLDDPSILDQLNRLDPTNVGKNITALFIKLTVALCREGGVVALILPSKQEESKTYQSVWRHVREQTHVLAQVELPAHTFKPWWGGSATLHLLQKGKRGSDQTTFKTTITEVGHDERATHTRVSIDNPYTTHPSVAYDQYGQNQPAWQDMGDGGIYDLPSRFAAWYAAR